MTKPSVMLDSNICIYLLEGLSESARERVEQHQPGAVVTSAVAYAEVMQGLDLEDPVSVAKTEALFDVIPILPFDQVAARAYSRIAFKRDRFDHLIAAHALGLGLVLVTNNIRHFRAVPGLNIEDWTAP